MCYLEGPSAAEHHNQASPLLLCWEGVDTLVIFHLQPWLTQPHTPGHTEQEQVNNRNTLNAPGRTLPRPGLMLLPCQRQQQEPTECGHPDPEAKLVLTP